MRFCGFLFSWMEEHSTATGVLCVRNQMLWNYDLISVSNYNWNRSPWPLDQRIYKLSKTRLGSLPSVVKDPQSTKARWGQVHNNDVIMTTIASHITSLTVVYSIVYSDADQRKHQSSASLAFVRGSHRGRWIPRTNGQLRGKMFPFDDVIM